MVRRATLSMLLISALTAGVSGCGGDDGGASSADGKLKVTTSFYPLEAAARAIGGDRVSVTNLTPLGGEPHDLDPSPAAIRDLTQSKLVFFLGDGFQPAVTRAVDSLGAGTRKVDLLRGVQLQPAASGIPGVRGEVEGGKGEALESGQDPHVWVDPVRYKAMVAEMAKQLIAADPDGRAEYERRAADYERQLTDLDAAFRTQLSDCKTRVLVTSHAAFGYLAAQYDLTQAPIAGISPEAEPDPKSLAATARYAKANGVKTVFFETLVPRGLADTMASEVGARTDALNPVEGLTRDEQQAGDTYVTIMRDNLSRLAKGLQCTGT